MTNRRRTRAILALRWRAIPDVSVSIKTIFVKVNTNVNFAHMVSFIHSNRFTHYIKPHQHDEPNICGYDLRLCNTDLRFLDADYYSFGMNL